MKPTFLAGGYERQKAFVLFILWNDPVGQKRADAEGFMNVIHYL